jgi:hypothetical protein
MSGLQLDVEIINKEKKEISGKRKMTLFSILGALWLFLLYSDPFDENSLYDQLGIWKGYPAILLFLLLISSGLILKYVFYVVPTKGRLILTEDLITVKRKRDKILIPLSEIQSVKFNEHMTMLEDIIVTIKLKSRRVNISDEINIPFVVERETLRKLVEIWKVHEVDAELTTTTDKPCHDFSQSQDNQL